MIDHELLREAGVLVVSPRGALQAADFENLAREVDPYIAERGSLAGLMICVESFPGWKDFAGLVSHLRFVRDHHRKIHRVAAVTDSGFLSIALRIAQHFVHADVRHFPYADRAQALAWLSERNPPETDGQ
jgi:hypothetical protein